MKAFAAIALAVGLALTAVGTSAADDARTVRVHFKAGTTGAVIADSIQGHEYVMYKLNAKEGQFLTVSLRPDNNAAGFNIYIPGKKPGDEALYNSEMGGNLEYYGQLYVTGDHIVSVFLNRAAARRGEVANYDLVLEVSALESAQPAVSEAESACLAAVANQVGTGDVLTISVDSSQAGTSVQVQVPGAQAPWNCVYQGGRVVDVWYMGEG
jgi:hypothetical protein